MTAYLKLKLQVFGGLCELPVSDLAIDCCCYLAIRNALSCRPVQSHEQFLTSALSRRPVCKVPSNAVMLRIKLSSFDQTCS